MFLTSGYVYASAEEAEAAFRITDGVCRVSVRLEDVRDLIGDFERALG